MPYYFKKKIIKIIFILSTVMFDCAHAQTLQIGLPSGHSAGILSVAFSNNGKLFVTSSFDNKAILWETGSGRIIYELNKNARVTSAEFSHDSKKIVTSDWMGNVSIWDVSSGKLISEIKAHTTAPNGNRAYFSANDQFIVSTALDSSAKIWDAKNGKLIFSTPKMQGALREAFLCYGDSVLATEARNGSIYFWSIPSGKFLKKTWNHKAFITAMSVNEANDEILTSSLDSTIVVWSYKKDTLIYTIKAEGPVIDAQYSPDKKIILATYDGNKMLLIERASGKIIRKFAGHTADMNDISFSADGTKILTSSEDSTARLWSVASGKELLKVKSNDIVFVARFLPGSNSYFITSSEDKSLCFWNAGTGSLAKKIQPKTDAIISSGFSSDGNFALSTSANSTTNIWDTHTGKILKTLSGHKAVVMQAVFSNDQNLIASVSLDKTLNIWDAKSGNIIHHLAGHTGAVRSVKFNFDNQKIITASADSTMILWDAKTGTILHRFKGHKSAVNSACFSPDGKKIISASRDSSAIIWNTETGDVLAKIPIGSIGLFANFNLKGDRFIVVGQKLAYVYETSSFKKLFELQPDKFFYGHADIENAANLILTSDMNGNVKVWSDNGKLIDDFKAHDDITTSAIISNDNKAILTSSYDHTLKLWNLNNKSKIITFVPITGEGGVSILPSNYYYGDKDAIKYLYFTNGLKTIGFDQLDVKYNRPDKVLEALGNRDTLLIKSYRKAYEKRIKRLNIDTAAFSDGYSIPEAIFCGRDSIEYEQKSEKFTAHIKGIDSTNKLNRFNIWVNGVPLYGARGATILRQNKNEIDTLLTIPLSKGENRIEVSVTNVNAAESYRNPLFVSYIPEEQNKPTTYFVGIGVNKFKDSRYNLSWSNKDIRDLASKLKEKISGLNIVDTLFDEKVTARNVKALKEKLLKTNVNDKVIIAYSGHGLLSKDFDYYLSSYDVDFSKPEERGIQYEELESLLDSIPARKKLLLIDACHSGEVDKEELVRIDSVAAAGHLAKGTKPVAYKTDQKHLGLKNSFELMQGLFVNVSKGTGAIVISAAAGTQFALERGDLRNGVFTYSILEAMENHQTIKVSELKNLVSNKVAELTHGLQKPTFRNEALDTDWDVW